MRTMKRLMGLVLAVMLLLTSVASAAPAIQESPDKSTYKKNTNDCPMDGLYTDSIEMDDGSIRTILHYYPTDLAFRRPLVFVAVPDGVDAAEYVEAAGWVALADSYDFMIMVMVPGEGGWKADELEYSHKVYDYAQDRAYYINDDSAYYMVGYGEAAANMVMAEAMTQADLYAGFACLGGTYGNAADMIATAQTTESAEPGRMQSTVPVPMWIGAPEKTEAVASLVNYWIAANECDAEDAYANQYAEEIYQYPRYLAENLNLTDNKPSKVLLSVGEKDYTDAAFTEYLWDKFLSRARRMDSWQVPALRYVADIDSELGMVYHELDVNGTKEWFYVYVPDAVTEGKMEKAPMMFVTHGSNGGADENALRGGMIPVAEQYNFIMVSCQNNSKAEIWKAVYDFMIANYPVDVSRVYVSGQSMGCSFSLTVAETYPELVACVAAASLLKNYSADSLAKRTINGEDLLMPVFISVGYLDNYFVNEGRSQSASIPDFGVYWMGRNGIEAEWLGYGQGWTNTYKVDAGIYHSWIGLNGQGFPIFRWQRVDGKVHAYTVEEGIQFYDYAIQWSRGEDGTLYYLGIPVTK